MGAEDDQHLAQAEVLAAEDVAAPDRAALRRQQMALGHVVDVDHVEDGVDVGRHLAVEEADDRSPGGRRGAVAVADRERRLGQHDVGALGGQAKGLVLGDVLRALVGPVELFDVRVGALDGVGAAPVVEADRADGAGDHDPAALRRRRLDDVAGAADVDVVEVGGVGQPERGRGRRRG